MIRSFKVALNWKAYLKDPHVNISLSTTTHHAHALLGSTFIITTYVTTVHVYSTERSLQHAISRSVYCNCGYLNMYKIPGSEKISRRTLIC